MVGMKLAPGILKSSDIEIFSTCQVFCLFSFLSVSFFFWTSFSLCWVTWLGEVPHLHSNYKMVQSLNLSQGKDLNWISLCYMSTLLSWGQGLLPEGQQGMVIIHKVSEVNSVAIIFISLKMKGTSVSDQMCIIVENKFRERIELSEETLWSLKGLELTQDDGQDLDGEEGGLSSIQ